MKIYRKRFPTYSSSRTSNSKDTFSNYCCDPKVKLESGVNCNPCYIPRGVPTKNTLRSILDFGCKQRFYRMVLNQRFPLGSRKNQIITPLKVDKIFIPDLIIQNYPRDTHVFKRNQFIRSWIKQFQHKERSFD